MDAWEQEGYVRVSACERKWLRSQLQEDEGGGEVGGLQLA